MRLSLFTALSPQPRPDALPARFPDPFGLPPHPLAQRAAAGLRERLVRGAAPLPPGPGKMFGVLVVRNALGVVGYLQAFSGLIGDRWELPGFVGGTWNAAEKERAWQPRVGGLKALSARIDRLSREDEAAARQALASFAEESRQALGALRAEHAVRKKARGEERQCLADATDAQSRLDALDQESRADDLARRRARRALAEKEAELRARLDAVILERRRLESERRDRCNEALHAVQDTYLLQNARGERKRLRELFAPRGVAGGAGDCVGPKLLLAAYEQALAPIALAEFWWGPPSRAGDRQEGAFYPACLSRCATVLPFMLEGLDIEEPMGHEHSQSARTP